MHSHSPVCQSQPPANLSNPTLTSGEGGRLPPPPLLARGSDCCRAAAGRPAAACHRRRLAASCRGLGPRCRSPIATACRRALLLVGLALRRGPACFAGTGETNARRDLRAKGGTCAHPSHAFHSQSPTRAWNPAWCSSLVLTIAAASLQGGRGRRRARQLRRRRPRGRPP